MDVSQMNPNSPSELRGPTRTSADPPDDTDSESGGELSKDGEVLRGCHDWGKYAPLNPTK